MIIKFIRLTDSKVEYYSGNVNENNINSDFNSAKELNQDEVNKLLSFYSKTEFAMKFNIVTTNKTKCMISCLGCKKKCKN